MLECDNGDILQTIYYGYSNSYSEDATTPQNPSTTVTTTVNSEQTKTYYYSLSYKSYHYIVINFYKSSSYGYNFKMILKATDTNPVSALVTIILAVVFSIVGLAIIIVVIVCVCICRKRRTVGMVGGPATYAPMAPQTPLVNANQAYPQAAPMY